MGIIVGVILAVVVWWFLKLTIGALLFLLVLGALVGSITLFRRRAK
jgi:hypothetical protein